jgi:hypothetical protein
LRAKGARDDDVDAALHDEVVRVEKTLVWVLLPRILAGVGTALSAKVLRWSGSALSQACWEFKPGMVYSQWFS